MTGPLLLETHALRAYPGILACALAPHADAALTLCHKDPIVTFANGIAVDLHVLIAATQSDVQHVSYVLYGPTGSDAPTSVIYPDGSGSISDLTFRATGQLNRYYAIVTVTTGAPSVPVTAYLDWTAGGVHNTGTSQVSGASGQGLRTPDLQVVCGTTCGGRAYYPDSGQQGI